MRIMKSMMLLKGFTLALNLRYIVIESKQFARFSFYDIDWIKPESDGLRETMNQNIL